MKTDTPNLGFIGLGLMGQGFTKCLINNGWFYRCRNTNYLGEMMIYSSYALLSQHHIPWFILGYIWSILFLRNIIKKEESLKKKDGWDAYEKQSGCLFPKINGNILPMTIYYRKNKD